MNTALHYFFVPALVHDRTDAGRVVDRSPLCFSCVVCLFVPFSGCWT